MAVNLFVIVDGEPIHFNSNTPELHQYLSEGWAAVRINQNTQQVVHIYDVRAFESSFLLDGCPMNIIFGKGWYDGQIDALKAANIVPRCNDCAPATVCNLEWHGVDVSAPHVVYDPVTYPDVVPTWQGEVIEPTLLPETQVVTLAPPTPYIPPLETEIEQIFEEIPGTPPPDVTLYEPPPYIAPTPEPPPYIAPTPEPPYIPEVSIPPLTVVSKYPSVVPETPYVPVVPETPYDVPIIKGDWSGPIIAEQPENYNWLFWLVAAGVGIAAMKGKR
jgi:hypothetical protein